MLQMKSSQNKGYIGTVPYVTSPRKNLIHHFVKDISRKFALCNINKNGQCILRNRGQWCLKVITGFSESVSAWIRITLPDTDPQILVLAQVK